MFSQRRGPSEYQGSEFRAEGSRFTGFRYSAILGGLELGWGDSYKLKLARVDVHIRVDYFGPNGQQP